MTVRPLGSLNSVYFSSIFGAGVCAKAGLAIATSRTAKAHFITVDLNHGIRRTHRNKLWSNRRRERQAVGRRDHGLQVGLGDDEPRGPDPVRIRDFARVPDRVGASHAPVDG